MTRVKITRSTKDRISFRFNNHVMLRPIVSKIVVNEYLSRREGHWSVLVEHTSKFPTGAGYGTSGAGAASLSLALNGAFQVRLSRIRALRIAHLADVKAKTGLGTV